MADNSQNQSSGSPWEDVLEEPEEKPKIYGSLDNSGKAAAPSGQFKVPGNIPDGVGSQVPGDKVAEKDAASQAGQPDRPLNQPPAATQPQQTIRPTPQTPTPTPQAPLANQTNSAPPPPPPTPKPSGISGLFKRKAAPITQTTAVPQAPPTQVKQPSPAPANPNQSSTPTQNPPAPKQPSPRQNLSAPIRQWFLKPKVVIAAIIIVLLVGLTYVNEIGLFSTGLEKVYGIFRLESLWGGLPADSQLALAQSFTKMKDQKSLRLDSEIKFTVNKNSESGVTKPLISMANSIMLFALDKATLAVEEDLSDFDLEDDTSSSTDTPTDSPSASSALDDSSSTSLTATTSDSQSSQSSTTTTPATTTTETTDSSQTDQGSSSSSSLETLSTVKEFSATAKAYLSTEGSTAKMEITSESNKKSEVTLYDQNNRLYINSTGVDYSGSSKNWVFLPLKQNADSELLPAVFSKPNLSGFSVTGKRIGSGKFNGEPVYRYQVNIKIGSLLESVGIKDEMVNSITGEIDISKKDQLIKYLELTITPSISSAITRIDFKGAVSDYNASETLTFPENATEIAGSTTQQSTTTTPATSTTTQIPITPASLSPTDMLSRDSQRKSDLRAVESALTVYFAEHQSYPSTNNQGIQTRSAGNILSTTLVPKYLTSLPVDPWSDKYYYGYKSDGSSYELTAVLGNNSDTEGTMAGGKNLFIIRH